ncbi:META domain-containing protein [Streptomyces sp. NPDC006012]|uniref:META domain-containing protein n=1 Tax=Streptomyces sp. NPDC006012 TaxID=3364739 RepID=UPI0036CBA2BA
MDSKRQRTMLLAAVALLPLAACGSERADGGSDSGSGSVREAVTGVHWNVGSVTADGATRRAPAGTYAEFSDGRIRGSYGCNQFSATAAFDGDRLRVGNAETTMMACAKDPRDPKGPADPMGFERILARTLADDPLTARVRGGDLVLTSRSGDTVRLTDEPDAPLRGTKWTITAFGADGTATSLPRGATAYLVLGKDNGKVTGRLGCNSVSADATVRDSRITLGTPVTTRMMCDASLMHVERRLLRFFGGSAEYRIDHRILTLTRENGESFSAVAEP